MLPLGLRKQEDVKGANSRRQIARDTAASSKSVAVVSYDSVRRHKPSAFSETKWLASSFGCHGSVLRTTSQRWDALVKCCFRIRY